MDEPRTRRSLPRRILRWSVIAGIGWGVGQLYANRDKVLPGDRWGDPTPQDRRRS